ncbi:type II secretion system protein GspL [Thiomicrorhabdus sp.]|uniref:type II secretion system protein GspL n=1 Tax=Thiomicrorhabdus sp. TaxID=2039724 RepID=UPI0029C7773B|nr:type II secretion system protein GspL [Thiomicrorhabdus sp.]
MLLTKSEQAQKISPPVDGTEAPAVVYFSLDGRLWVEQASQRMLFEDAFSDSAEAARFLKRMKVAWVPSEQVVLSEVTVPGKRRSDWMAALPYALEERLSGVVETYHFVPFKRFPDGRTLVATVPHASMQAWTESLASVGGGHLQLVADCFRLPAPQESSWNRICDHERCLLRSGGCQGFGSSSVWFDSLLNSARQQADSPVELVDVPAVSLADSTNRTEAALNLRSGPYGGKQGNGGAWKIWAWPAAAVLFLGVLSLVDTSIQTQQWQAEAQTYRQQSKTLFKQLFPQTKRIVNIKSQTLSNLKGMQGAAPDAIGFMPWLRQLEPLVQTGKGVRIDKLDWSLKQKQLSFYLQAGKTESLQILEGEAKKRLPNAQVRLQLKTATPQLVEGILYVAAP